jgi:hypothetical protein
MAHIPWVADQPVLWRCSCGHASYAHYEHCANCGRSRPEPQKQVQPDDIEPLKEVI